MKALDDVVLADKEQLVRASKSQIILFLFESFVTAGSLKKQVLMDELEIPEITFRRYLAEIRGYFDRFDKDGIIYYDKKHDIYVYQGKLSRPTDQPRP